MAAMLLWLGMQRAAAGDTAAPPIAGPLQAPAPHSFDGGALGSLVVNGVASGVGLWQGNPAEGNQPAQAALTNGQVFVRKNSGWWQFYVQAGAYDIPVAGSRFVGTGRTTGDLYGPAPVSYLKLIPARNTSILIGSLPTLLGAEYPFTFQNMNVSRGLLWNQENTINRGIQVNQAAGRFTAALSWNDGFYSNRYSCLGGSLTYAGGPHSVTFAAQGNLSRTVFQTLATPVQNNGSVYVFLYGYTKGRWIIQPYGQLSRVPSDRQAGIARGASAAGGAILANRTLGRGFSVAGRVEYLSSTGTPAEHAVNLMYGAGSAAWSFTLTPTLQHRRLFVRGDLCLVRASRITPGLAFGPAGTKAEQRRAIIEAGILF